MKAHFHVRDAVVAAVIVAASYYFYVYRDLIFLAVGAVLCKMFARSIVAQVQPFGGPRWRPTRLQATLIAFFVAADLLILLFVLLPAAKLDLVLDAYRSHVLSVIVAVINELPPPKPMVTHSHLVDATTVGMAILFLGLYSRDERESVRRRTRGSNFRNSLVGHSTIVLAAGIGSFVAFGLIGLPHYDALALIVGFGSLVPIAGPLVVSAISSAAAVSLSSCKLVAVLSYLIVYYELENKVLRRRQSDLDFMLSTLAVLASLMLGMTAGGLTGALIAVGPVMVAVLVIASLAQSDQPRAATIDACRRCDLAARPEVASRNAPHSCVTEPEVDTPTVEVVGSKICAEMLAKTAISGIVTLSVLQVLHIRYPWMLAGLTAAANLLPVVGSMAAILACAAVAGADSTLRLIGVLAFFLIYSQISPLLISQRIRRRYADPSFFAVPLAVLGGVIVATAAISIIAIVTAVVTVALFFLWVLAKRQRTTKWPSGGSRWAAVLQRRAVA